MRLQFSLGTFLVVAILTSTALYLGYEFWPRRQIPGNPNLVGRVLDPDGNPVANATIGIYDHARGPSSSYRPHYQTTTTRNGIFRLESIDMALADRKDFFVFYEDEIQRAQCADNWLTSESHAIHPGVFFIKVDHEKYCLAEEIDNDSFLNGCYAVDMIEDYDHKLTFKMAVGGTVSGTLTFDNGVPVADSSIRLVSKKNPNTFERI